MGGGSQISGPVVSAAKVSSVLSKLGGTIANNERVEQLLKGYRQHLEKRNKTNMLPDLIRNFPETIQTKRAALFALYRKSPDELIEKLMDLKRQKLQARFANGGVTKHTPAAEHVTKDKQK